MEIDSLRHCRETILEDEARVSAGFIVARIHAALYSSTEVFLQAFPLLVCFSRSSELLSLFRQLKVMQLTAKRLGWVRFDDG